MAKKSESRGFAYRFLQDIAQDLSRKDLKFPTFIDASLGVRMALGKKELSNAELARVVSSEPLLSARVVALANSVALNPSGREPPGSNADEQAKEPAHGGLDEETALAVLEEAAREVESLLAVLKG